MAGVAITRRVGAGPATRLAVAGATQSAAVVGVAGLAPATGRRPAIAASKRALDILVAGSLLVLSAPLFLLLALVVCCDGGPALFRQRRITTGGRVFEMTKFRSMAVDAEERLRADPELHAAYIANGFKLTADQDPRFARWGRFLRSSSLDELPQLFSVLRGDMSMVGPRPIVEPELVEYTRRGGHQVHLSTRPGLTGLWQVSGRSALSYDHRVSLDVDYMRRASLGMDLKILAKTVLVVVQRVGAH